ncbi:MAG: SAM-dependent methyltransferase [Sphingomicrobium sp.]
MAYVELGPGRGTLAADALRVMRSAGLDPPVHFVETSSLLREAQAAAVPGATWHDSIAELPNLPLLAVANEFFDALPIRQFVAGRERRVMAAAGGLAFDRDGEIEEESPARVEAMKQLAAKLTRNGGAALIIDYGHERSASGDTLQAVRRHRFAHVLEAPGEQDLTSHVDFEALTKAAIDAGAAVTNVVEQGPWLDRLGIIARAATLAARAPERADEIEAARARLCRPDAMGALFKVMAVHAPGWPAPAGF